MVVMLWVERREKRREIGDVAGVGDGCTFGSVLVFLGRTGEGKPGRCDVVTSIKLNGINRIDYLDKRGE